MSFDCAGTSDGAAHRQTPETVSESAAAAVRFPQRVPKDPVAVRPDDAGLNSEQLSAFLLALRWWAQKDRLHIDPGVPRA